MRWLLTVFGLGLIARAFRRSEPVAPPPVFRSSPTTGDQSRVLEEEATASFYGPGFDGKLTANGEVFDKRAMTAAMRSPMPFNTMVRVTDLDNGRSVIVRVNDRGPFAKDSTGRFTRAIDLSEGAAAAIGLDISKGLARVRLEIV